MVKPKRARSARRAEERRLEKLWAERAKLARLDPGGTPQHPLDIESASVVEARAEREPCLRCGNPVRCVEHRAEGGLRLARVQCKHCAAERSYYFRLATPSLN